MNDFNLKPNININFGSPSDTSSTATTAPDSIGSENAPETTTPTGQNKATLIVLGAEATIAAITAVVMWLKSVFKRKDIDKQKEKEKEIITHKTDEEIRLAKEKAKINNEAKQSRQKTNTENLDSSKTTEGISENGDEPVVATRFVDIKTKDIIEYTPIVPSLIVANQVTTILGPEKQGKSLLAMQIAIEAASGQKSSLVNNDYTKEPVHVIYYDGELLEADYKERYFSKEDVCFPRGIELIIQTMSAEKLIKDLRDRLKRIPGDCLVIIDNLKSFTKIQQTENVKAFFMSIKAILRSETERTVSFIVMCHPKTAYKPHKPITTDDVEGAKDIRDYTNNLIALVPTRIDDNTKMIKTLLYRSPDAVKGKVNVVHFEDSPYPHFEHMRYDYENGLLPPPQGNIPIIEQSESPADEVSEGKLSLQEISEIKRRLTEGETKTSIAQEYGVSRPTLDKYLKQSESMS